MTNKSYISLWLLPEPNCQTFLQNLINNLAKKYDAYVFCPHLTIISGFYADPAEVVCKIDKIVKPIQNFCFTAESVELGETITQTLFIKMKLDQSFEQYCAKFATALKEYGGNVPLPHLSLLYKKGGSQGSSALINEQRRITDKLLSCSLPFEFNRAALMISPHRLVVDTDASKYQTYATY